jgi:DNA polymerase III delta prime subunit
MKPSDLIGKSGKIAALLLNQVPKLTAPGCSIMDRRYLFTGKPGLAKSAIAEMLGRALVTHELGIEAINGQSCIVDRIREWQFHGQFAPMFGMRVQIVDEIDMASTAALSQLRTYLDRLPSKTVFIGTTNRSVEDLPEQLQSRFKILFFDPISIELIAEWLQQKFPRLGAAMAESIAIQSNGNVRAAETVAMSVADNWVVSQETEVVLA